MRLSEVFHQPLQSCPLGTSGKHILSSFLHLQRYFNSLYGRHLGEWPGWSALDSVQTTGFSPCWVCLGIPIHASWTLPPIFSLGTDAILFLALLYSGCPLPIPLYPRRATFFLLSWHWPPKVPGRFRLCSPIQIAFLPATKYPVYPEPISGHDGVSAAPWGRTFYRPDWETWSFHV